MNVFLVHRPNSPSRPLPVIPGIEFIHHTPMTLYRDARDWDHRLAVGHQFAVLFPEHEAVEPVLRGPPGCPVCATLVARREEPDNDGWNWSIAVYEVSESCILEPLPHISRQPKRNG